MNNRKVLRSNSKNDNSISMLNENTPKSLVRENIKIHTLANAYIICRTPGKVKILGLLFKKYVFQYSDHIALSQVGKHPE